MIMVKKIEKRKADHIDACLKEEVAPTHGYWEEVKLVHESLPEVDFDEIDTSTILFGRKLSFPLIVTAITGGYPMAERINSNLAEACSTLQVGMGVGSERAALEKGETRSYAVLKDYDIPLRIGNIGAPQLVAQQGRKAFGQNEARRAIELLDAHLLAVHLNYLQEIVQPGGDTNARGCLDAIRNLARELPIIAKETGAGISRGTALRLKGAGVRGLDVSGTGGTSFAAVERYRAELVRNAKLATLGHTFCDWGIPAPVAVSWANVGLPIIASGGILNGSHIAKGMALGADCGGTARAVLKDALEGPKAVQRTLETMRTEFKAAMFLTGCEKVADLAKRRVVLTGLTREWSMQLDLEE
jgi:isopentenyl-diphosphate Delta-isomerase